MPFDTFYLAPALLAGGALYFLPAIVAGLREHPQRVAIFVLNALLGWSGLGWIGALVWASTAINRPPAGELERRAP